MVIEIIGPQHGASKAAQQIIFFVGRAIGSDHGDGRRAVLLHHVFEAGDGQFQCLFPGACFLLAVLADERRGQPLFMIDKVPAKAALDAKKFAIEARVIPIVGANDLIVADRQRRLASIARSGCRWCQCISVPRGGSCNDRCRW